MIAMLLLRDATPPAMRRLYVISVVSVLSRFGLRTWRAAVTLTAPRWTLSILQVLQQVPVGNSGRNEFRPGAQHLAEQDFTGFVNERHLFQIYYGARQRRPIPGLPPARAQFFNPLAARVAAEAPALAVCGI
jgi:hypothetical protein